jgi:hypothetical protein
MHLLAEGIEGVAKALGDILLTAAIDKDGMQSLVETLGSMGGLEEEKASGCIVHNGLPVCESFRSRIRSRKIAKSRSIGDGRTTERARRQRKNRRKQSPARVIRAQRTRRQESEKAMLEQEKAHTRAHVTPANRNRRSFTCED